MEKVERLISIIMILLKKDVVSAQTFARLFNVSKRTILRDMETLSMSNIPIYAINGVNGGYAIMDEYKVDKRLLSSTDLENILTALSGLEKIYLNEEIEMTIRKIEAMVNPHSSNKGSIHLSFYEWKGRAEISESLKMCQEAIAKRRLVSFHYIDKLGVATKRIVEPYQLHFSESSWYLKGYCTDRLDYRTFKLSRINDLTSSEQSFVARDDLLMEPEKKGSYQPELVTVKAFVSPSISDQLIERYGRKSLEAYSAEHLLATLTVPQNNIGFQFIAGLGTNIQLLEPEAYVEEFKRYLLQMVNQYRT